MLKPANNSQMQFDQHKFCLLCGNENPMSMRLKFVVDELTGKVSANFRSHLHLQGYTGIMHGGVICALLDSEMTNLLFSRGIKAVTGELNVKFHHSVPCTAEITVSAELSKAIDPLYLVNAELHFQKSLMASAQAKFMRTV